MSSPANASSSEKLRLRRSLLTTRQALSPEDWRDRSDRLCQTLANHPAFRRATTVLGYFSTRNEPNLDRLMTTGDRRWGFPRCVGHDLSWHRWRPGEPLERGAFGIREPHASAAAIAPDAVDLLLVPAVACDERGYRLGYGGGFYDRLLSRPEWQSVPTLGVTFDFACVPQLPVDPWDLPLHGVCTESRSLACQTYPDAASSD